MKAVKKKTEGETESKWNEENGRKRKGKKKNKREDWYCKEDESEKDDSKRRGKERVAKRIKDKSGKNVR